MRVIPIAAFDRWLYDTRSVGPVTLLVGSAISLPSGLPTGQQVATLLSNRLALDIPTRNLVLRLVERTAFEHIMEACPRQQELRRTVARLYEKNNPNACHEAIARLVASGAVQHVITTNYDCCLDDVLGSRAIQRVMKPEHMKKWDPDQPTYFKIHGCASDPDSLVLTLSGEPTLTPWKKELLTQIVTDHRLVVIGYSGLDFEICPELIRLNLTLAWVCQSPPSARSPYHPSPGGISVLSGKNATAVHGDMCDVLASLGTDRPTVIFPDSVPLPDGLFLFGGSDADRARNLDLWRCQLFRHVGCARAAAAAAKRLMKAARTNAQTATAHHYLGLAAFHAGKYRDAGRAYRTAATLVGPPHDENYLFDAVIADRCAGLEEQALASLGTLRVRAPQHRPQLLLRKLEFLAPRYESALAQGEDGDAMQIQAEARPLAQELAAAADQPGARFEHQQCDLLARRLHLGSSVDACADAPAPSREGFTHLGYFVARATAIRQDIVEGRDIPDCADALLVFRDLNEMGARAEAWKFGLALCARFRHQASFRVLLLSVWNHIRCQYTWKQRRELAWQIWRRARAARAASVGPDA